MNLLIRADATLLAKFQKLSDLIQRMFGITCRQISKALLWLSTPLLLGTSWLGYYKSGYFYNAITMMCMLYIVVSLISYLVIELEEEDGSTQDDNEEDEDERSFTSAAWIRIVGHFLLLCFVCMFFIGWSTSWRLYDATEIWSPSLEFWLQTGIVVSGFVVLVFFYFDACIPKPPSEEKETQLATEAS